MGIWLQQVDLENAVSKTTLIAVCADDDSQTPNPATVAQLIDRGEQEVLSWLATELGPPPFSVALMAQLAGDNFLKYAALEYVIAHVFDRHPEYVRSNGEERGSRFKRADERMERVLDARQRPPTVATPPANTGGVCIDNGKRLVTDNADGTSTSGDY